MSRSYLNLAREPYLNTRPVVRLSIVLWVIGALLFAGNVWLYWDFLAGRGDTHARLEEVAGEIETTRGRIVSLESELAGFDLADQNDRVEFLNSRIDRRLFSWSQLFDALAALLPDDVRLTRLAPSALGAEDRTTRRTRTVEVDDARVTLSINGVARSNESVLALVDNLFADPAFEGTTLTRQRTEQGGLISFDMETIYDPRAGQHAAVEPDQPAPPDGDAAAEDAAEPAVPQKTAEDLRPAGLGAAASSAPEVVR